MSTYLFLKCTAHDPPIFSDDVGQHLYDLPRIRESLKNRDNLIETPGTNGWEYPNDMDYFDRHVIKFLYQHPRCELEIEDEYDVIHPLEEI